MSRHTGFSWACVAITYLFVPTAMAKDSEATAESQPADTASARPAQVSPSGASTEGELRVLPSATDANSTQAGAPLVDEEQAQPDDAPPTSEATPATSGEETASPQQWDLAQLSLQPATANIRLAARAELGTLAVVAHKIQFGENGTSFDYVRDGGQENLFPFARFSAEVNLFSHHNIVFLYQPLTLETDVALRNNLDVYSTRFDADTPMQLKYGFDFARVSYFYDFWADPRQELGIGASLQIRNATINFGDVAGTRLVSNRNVGPVPILKARWRSTFENDVFVGAEIDGFYASIPIANGDLESQVEGAICDASLRVGAPVVGFANAFINLRYLGGGSSGFERGDDVEGDGFTDNWLHTVAISLGAELQ